LSGASAPLQPEFSAPRYPKIMDTYFALLPLVSAAPPAGHVLLGVFALLLLGGLAILAAWLAKTRLHLKH